MSFHAFSFTCSLALHFAVHPADNDLVHLSRWLTSRDTTGLSEVGGITKKGTHLDVWGFEQQVAEWFVAGRRQHRVLYVVDLQTQRAKVVGLVLVSVPFGLQKVPAGHKDRQRFRVSSLFSSRGNLWTFSQNSSAKGNIWEIIYKATRPCWEMIQSIFFCLHIRLATNR